MTANYVFYKETFIILNPSCLKVVTFWSQKSRPLKSPKAGSAIHCFASPGSSGTGSAAVAVAAAQAVSTTLQMNRRGGGTLKAPYVTALGNAPYNIWCCHAVYALEVKEIFAVVK